MKTAVLFSGGKDSVYSAYLAKQAGHELTCLISVISKNKESYMFHTPSIKKTKAQAKVIGLPLLIQKTKGEKEKELKDLEKVIAKAKKKNRESYENKKAKDALVLKLSKERRCQKNNVM